MYTLMRFNVRRGAYAAAWVFAFAGAGTGTSGCGATKREFGSGDAGSAGTGGGGSYGAPAKAGAAGVAAGSMPGSAGDLADPGGKSGVEGGSGGDTSVRGGASGLAGARANGLGGASSGGVSGQPTTNGGGPTTSGGTGNIPPVPCGNGALDGGEACDDGNAMANDGCSATCQVEAHWQCKAGAPSACTPTCGDGFVVGAEAKAGGCDDHNQLAGDGCSATCTVEASYFCAGVPSVCAKTCGNGKLESGEACDDGNSVKGDGCFSCAIESGFSCDTALPTKCTLVDPCAALKPCTGTNQCMNTTPGSYTCVCTPVTMASACTGKCDMVSNGCTGTYTCAGCSAPQTCGGGGSANVCGCAPTPMASACSGKCGSVDNGCGGTYTCSTCTAGANAIATCQSNQCVNSCAPGVLPLACPNAPADQALCAAWDFETNTLEGWGMGDPSDFAITAKTTIAVSTTRHFSGTHSLVVDTTIPGGEDTNGNLQQLLTLQAPLCSDISSINLLNRLFKIHAYFEYVSGSHLTAPNATFSGGSETQTGAGVDSVGSSPFTVAEGQWLSGSAQVAISATHLDITIGVTNALPTPWQGRVYLDGLSVQ